MENQLRKFFEHNLSTYLEIYKKMVLTNSFTTNVEGVNKTGQLTADAFTPLGFEAETIQSVNPEFGKHLILTKKGYSGRKIGLITHLDTVFPPEEEAAHDFTWRVEGDRIYGPGTCDIKGGTLMILMMMEGLRQVARKRFDDITWIILANAAEERWSKDFGKLCRQRLDKNALAALVFEAGYYESGDFNLVTERKGMAVYDIYVEGKSAHAGSQHPSGANAIVQMSEIVQRIADLSDYEKNLTTNIGFFSGGTVPNRVPHSARARGEIRSFSKEIFEEGVNDLLKISSITPLKSANDDFTCSIDIQVILENAPWPSNSDTDKVFRIWKETGQSMGYSVHREKRGGLSDGNQLWDFVPTIDGLGPNGRHSHCSERCEESGKEQ
jgi:glutamate carboxypeptidase